jgi:hypothetical protein
VKVTSANREIWPLQLMQGVLITIQSQITSPLSLYMNTMAETTASNENVLQAASLRAADNLGQPREQLEVDDGGISDENITYPTGPKLWLTMASLCLACFLTGLVGSHGMAEGIEN